MSTFNEKKIKNKFNFQIFPKTNLKFEVAKANIVFG